MTRSAPFYVKVTSAVVLAAICMPSVPIGLWPAIPALFTIPLWPSWFREGMAAVTARRIMRRRGAFDTRV